MNSKNQSKKLQVSLKWKPTYRDKQKITLMPMQESQN